jgi:hypothetical protein
MKKAALLFSITCALAITAKAQDSTKTEPSLSIFGSVDTYYKYDFSGIRNGAGSTNIPTSFATDQNSISIGMIDLGLKKKVGKAAFVGELSFGPRGQAQSIPNAAGVYDETTNSFNIQNLYVSYDLTDKLTATMGYMATFVGYEVIAPTGNFNYSTSYLFTNGPFQNPGVKLSYAFSDKVSLMAGVFNDRWNTYMSSKRVNTFGAQLMVAPVTGWTAYLNVLAGNDTGNEFDLTTSYQVTDAFKLGLNAATYSAPGDIEGGFSGVALYPQVAVAKSVTLGLRGEYFKTKSGSFLTYGPAPGESVTAITFTANIKAGPLTFLPEFRFDNGSQNAFVNSNGAAAKSASQILFAAVYAF